MMPLDLERHEPLSAGSAGAAGGGRMRPLDWRGVPLHGTQLIEASAGTGKTYTITLLYLRLLLEGRTREGRRLGAEDVLVVTFTRAATAELQERIRARLGEAIERLQAPVETWPQEDPLSVVLSGRPAAERVRDAEHLLQVQRSLDKATISTIHGFCERALRSHAFASGTSFGTRLVEDFSELVRELTVDFWVKETASLSREQLLVLTSTLGGPDATLERLLELARAVATDPIAVVPKLRFVAEELRAAEACFAQRRAEALLAVQQAPASDRLERWLTQKGLGKTFTSRNLTVWLRHLQTFLGGEPSTNDPKLLEAVTRFTPAALEPKCAKASIDPKSIPACCAMIAGALDAYAELERARLAMGVDLQQRFIAWLRAELPERKRALGVLGFDDLLHRLDAALDGDQGRELARELARRFPAALIDEFQDTDPVQYRVFRAMAAAGTHLLLIGDPKQAIYAFRGADVRAYLDAARGVKEEVFTLDVNHRSDPSLIHGINRLFAQRPNPFLIKEIGFTPVAPKPGRQDALLLGGEPWSRVVLEWVSRPEDRGGKELPKGRSQRPLARHCASKIQALLASEASLPDEHAAPPARRRVVPADVAVLVQNNRQALLVQRELGALGIPAVLRAASTVLETDEATELWRLLSAVLEPHRSRLVSAALTTVLVGLRATELQGLFEASSEPSAARSRELLDALSEARSLWQRHGVLTACRWLERRLGLAPRLLACLDGERRLTNLRHSFELLHQLSAERHLGPRALLQEFEQAIASARLEARAVSREELQLRLESDERAVTLITVHSAKGLEFPIVYCPFLWEGVLRKQTKRGLLRYFDPEQGKNVLDLNPADDTRDARVALASRELVAEQLRLVYVALTRARHRVEFSWGVFNGHEHAALGYLLHGRGEGDGALPGKLSEQPDEALLDALRGWAEETQGAVEVTSISLDAPKAKALGAPTPAQGSALPAGERGAGGAPSPALQYSARVLPEPIQRGAQATSFSGLTRFARGAGARAPERDHDEATGLPLAFGGLPRTAAAGSFIHRVYERHDFQASREALAQIVREELRAFALQASDPERLITELSEVLDCPLGVGGPSLRELEPARCLKEPEFAYPAGEGEATRLSAQALAQAFARHRSEAVLEDYPRRVEELGFHLYGYLRGAIDLIFEHEGRFFVVDYKSNALGPSARDYQPEALRNAMAEHHYVLQYHLYTLALHRYLGLTLPGYRYEEHFGGVYYLFLRGMQPGWGVGSGVVYDRPSLSLVEALSRVMQGGAT